MALIRHQIVGPLTDALIRNGLTPTNDGLAYSLFRWAQSERDNDVPRRHPLYDLTREPDWDTTYALSRSALLWLWDRSLRIQPRCIIDVGGGRSTVMFALYARQRLMAGGGHPRVISIEHDPVWQARTATSLRRERLDKFVHQLLIPLRSCSFRSRPGQTYDIKPSCLSPVLARDEADFLLIDGPPGDVGRHHALASLVDYLPSGANIFVDDIDRPSMRDLIDHWSTNPLGLTLKGVFPFVCGFAWLRKEPR